LEISLLNRLNTIAKSYGFELERTLFEDKIHELITKLAQQGKVVLLIDECDYPFLKHITQPQAAKTIGDILGKFFTVIKDLEGKYIHFMFTTGVTTFSKKSFFSGMNDLNDISLTPKAATLLGHTKDEIERYLASNIALLAKEKNKEESKILQEMEIWYNGYRFCDDLSTPKVYNPSSIFYCLDRQKFSNYWLTLSTPTFLIELLKKHHYAPESLHSTDVMVSSDSLKTFDIDEVPPLYTLLFQTGYLTIKSFDEALNAYTLTCPNEEVRLSTDAYLLSIITNKNKQHSSDADLAIRQALEEHGLRNSITENI
jgi:hypothetical protein